MNDTVNILEWMLSHKGLAVARVSDGNKSMEVIDYSEEKQDYDKLIKRAEQENLAIVSGLNKEGDSLGYLAQ